MNLDLQELMHINGMAADAATVKAELDATKAALAEMTQDRDQWRDRALMSEDNNRSMLIENACLKYILLRKDRVHEFFTHTDPINQPLLLTFIIKTLPENTPVDVFESVRDMLDITPKPSAPVIQHADQVNIDSKDIAHTTTTDKTNNPEKK